MYLHKKHQTVPRKIPVRGEKSGIITEAQNIVDQNTAEPVGYHGVDSDNVTAPAVDKTDWQTTALRLQADMDNFRKRQNRRAEEAVAAERERLLSLLLPVADNLTRALNHENQGDESLRQGVELIYRELMRSLQAEGVTRLETIGHPFSPSLHEAVATIPADIEPGTIVEEVEAGYKLGDKLLRPARVVVAAS